MQRYFGMMPKDEVKIEKVYKDSFNLKIIVQAGEHGWSILFADCSSEFEDVDDTPENNFETAIARLKTYEMYELIDYTCAYCGTRKEK